MCLCRPPRLWYASRSQALVEAQLKMGADRESRKRAWEENELSSLAKAIVKFPAGSQNREHDCLAGCKDTLFLFFSFLFGFLHRGVLGQIQALSCWCATRSISRGRGVLRPASPSWSSSKNSEHHMTSRHVKPAASRRTLISLMRFQCQRASCLRKNFQ